MSMRRNGQPDATNQTEKAENAYIREQIVMRINPEEDRVFKMESDIRKPLINSAAKQR